MKTYTYAQKVRKILRIALPSGANSFLDIIVLALGTFFMGQFGDEYMVALSIGLQFMMLFYAINAVFYIGTNAQISRFYGARDSKSAASVFYSIITLCCVCSVPIVFIALFSRGAFISWMGLSEKASALADVFLFCVIFSLPAMLLKNIITSAFAAIGDTLSVFIVRIFTTIFCLVANYLLIFSCSLNILGAALANVLTSYVELIIFIFLARGRGGFFARDFRVKIVWEYFYMALKIGIPSGIERALTLGSLVLTTRIIADFGDLAVAGSQVGSRIEAFAFMPGFGFMVAAMALTGQNLGANRVNVAVDLNKTILQISSVIMGVLGILMVVLAYPLSSIFTQNEEAMRISVWYLIAVGLSQIPLSWVFVIDGVLRGAGITNASLAINAFSVWCVRIAPMWIGICAGAGLWWVFVMIFVETYIRAMIFYAVYKRGVWKKAKL